MRWRKNLVQKNFSLDQMCVYFFVTLWLLKQYQPQLLVLKELVTTDKEDKLRKICSVTETNEFLKQK